MRRLAPVVLLLATTACSRGLKRPDAEAKIRARYPVTVSVKVPGRVSAAVGSPEAGRAQAFMDNLQKTGWFEITREAAKADHVVYTFTPKAGSPIQASGTGWLVPAAQAVFVKSTRHSENGDRARVTYLIRLANPTAQFALFQMLHPAVRIGDAKPREATFEKKDGEWVLKGTDEIFTKDQ